MRNASQHRRTIEETLNRLYQKNKGLSSGTFLALILVYILDVVMISITAGSSAEVSLLGYSVPVYTFAGILSSLANICIILLAVYYDKIGFITALILMVAEFPMMLVGIIVKHNVTSLPGVFGNILTLIAIIIIYLNNRKVSDYQKVLRTQAVTDMLTGLPNWFAVTELIEALVERKEPFAVVNIDINGFKVINDAMGFETGNKVLIDISSKWKKIADSGISGTVDFIARLNGDEFSLVIRRFRTEDDILNTIRQYEAVLNDQMNSIGYDFYISASFGYAVFPDDTENMDTLISYSYLAMQEIKHASSSEHILKFTPEIQQTGHSLEIEGKIRTALDNDNVFFMLQPQFDMLHNLRGFEALARMRDTDGTVIPPAEFIPVAEKAGLIDKIDLAVIRKSAAFIGNIICQTGSNVTLSVNVSVRHLMKKGFLEEIREMIDQSGIPAKQLEIEITESVMIESLEKVMSYIEELRNMGIQIAIDDFGTGYSSLSYLNSIPATLLKIDKSFIDKMNSSEKSKQYVAAIISLGHIMGYEVISEGVEENDQLETLKSIGCDYIQGYIWGRPLPEEEAAKLIV
ncbi:MAG: bifunctional diguanylate cyclase/phosphodiesterase [Lachnospiraceae bacterium]|nr:bifunctional diguanylate cyclase/phosphodiesterase [Lachnospiraceae bacterium]